MNLHQLSTAALRAACLAATLALMGCAASVQVTRIPDCKPGQPVCDEYLRTVEQLDRYRKVYLDAVGACGREDACTPRIKPNAGPVPSGSLSRTFDYALSDCEARCEANHEKGSAELRRCKNQCGGTALTP